MNQYVAFGNNPVNFVDPSGLCEEGGDPGWNKRALDWMRDHWGTSLTINVGNGMFGGNITITLKDGKLFARGGVGWGIGMGGSVAGGPQFGDSRGFDITGSVSGGEWFGGGSISGTFSTEGTSGSIEGGLGQGGGASITVGYSGQIFDFGE